MELETAELAPWVAAVGNSGPWMVLGALTLRGLHQWTKHLCELAPRVLTILEGVQRDGIRVRVSFEEKGDSDVSAKE